MPKMNYEKRRSYDKGRPPRLDRVARNYLTWSPECNMALATEVLENIQHSWMHDECPKIIGLWTTCACSCHKDLTFDI